MACASNKDKITGIENQVVGKNVFIGEMNPIPKTDFVLSLPPGQYLLISIQTIKYKLKAKIFSLNDKTCEEEEEDDDDAQARILQSLGENVELGKHIVETIMGVMNEINGKIDELAGVPGGGDDPSLEELYGSLDKFLVMCYDVYVPVRSDYFCESTRQNLLIYVAAPAPFLLYKDDQPKEAKVVTLSSVSNGSGKQGSTSLAFPESLLPLRRLETFIPQEEMCDHWKRFWAKYGCKKDKDF